MQITTYKGRDIRTLTHEELIVAMEKVCDEFERFRESVADGYRLDAELRQAEQLRPWARRVMGA